MARIRSILFDLDGTLIDSAPDLASALNWVRAGEGLPPMDPQTLSPHVSRGAAGMIQAGMPQANDEQVNAWKVLFLEQYAQHSSVHSRFYDGIPELLDRLEADGILWGIVTNKSEMLTHPILEAFKLSSRTTCVVCGDTLSRSKPDPAPVRYACGLLGVAEHETVFAGDDYRDLQAGRAAGTITAAIHYGYGRYDMSDELVASSAQINHPSDFLKMLSERSVY